MQKEYYLINEAAKEVQVEAHVLRYWEEELGLPIRRNAKGHRLYSGEDVLRFIKIKKLKEEGLQLKAVKRIIKDMSIDVPDKETNKVINFQMKRDSEYVGNDKVSDIIAEIQESKHENRIEDEQASPIRIEIKQAEIIDENKIESDMVDSKENQKEMQKETQLIRKMQSASDEKREKAMRIQALLRHMINDSIQMKQEDMVKEIKENISKELDYQFRHFEEYQHEMEQQRMEREERREEEQKEREEKHFKRIDELLRIASVKGKRKKLS